MILIKTIKTIKATTKVTVRETRKKWEGSTIHMLNEEENLHTPKEGYVKSKASRGKNGGTWVNPYIFIKLAMWINPKFEVQVIKFVYDQLIEFRHAAGDNYNVLTSALKNLKNAEYPKVAQALNYIVFVRL